MDKLEYEDLKYRLEAEGEGYALKHYYGRNIDHDDKKVVKLWAEAFDKLIELKKYIDQKVEEKCD
tara:strand:+ start:137 stop:331 length:195 start_codon:yes stop_codon:yes gene_type:complete